MTRRAWDWNVIIIYVAIGTFCAAIYELANW